MGDTYLIAGLGNPGSEYEHTRHNAGFMVIDLLSEEMRANYWKKECGSLASIVSFDGKEIILAKPQSFMNASGGPVRELMRKYDVPADHLIVIQDELDIERGTIRVKAGGGHAGHNGLRSIIDKIQAREFIRIRIGIGHPPGRMPVSDYVLRQPRGEEADEFEHALALGAQACIYLLENGVVKTQDKFN